MPGFIGIIFLNVLLLWGLHWWFSIWVMHVLFFLFYFFSYCSLGMMLQLCYRHVNKMLRVKFNPGALHALLR